jgi:hypothetical protein
MISALLIIDPHDDFIPDAAQFNTDRAYPDRWTITFSGANLCCGSRPRQSRASPRLAAARAASVTSLCWPVTCALLAARASYFATSR